jgi:D-glycerate 3-kinase
MLQADEVQRYLTTVQAQADPDGAFAIAPQTAEFETRSHQFRTLFPALLPHCQALGLTDRDRIAADLWALWLPLAQQLSRDRETLGRPVVQGLLGGQGTGKTTLARILGLILDSFDCRSVQFSLDDLYKSYIERQQLQQADPRLIWRGPPGTHDVAIGIDLLDKLRQARRRLPVIVPRFDKSAVGGLGDKAAPEVVDGVDVVIFEGWCVGARPVDPQVFDDPPDPIVTESDRTFARDMNDRLFDYVPLWHRLDRLLILQPVDYRLSQQWRKDAEHQMIAQGKSGLSDAEIDQFVAYFWKALHPELFITPLTQNPLLTDLVVEIGRDRTLGRIYRP